MKLNYYLLSALVIYQRDKLERTRHFNILITSKTATVTRTQLGRAQQQAQVRFFTEFDKDQKSEVVDVFVQSVSHLGEMTEAEFHEDFPYPGKPEAEPEGQPVDEPMADPAPEITETETLTEVPVDDVTQDEETVTNGQPKGGMYPK